MKKNRLEALSNGVLAAIITIMVLELKAPHDVSAQALLAPGATICCSGWPWCHL